MRIEFKLKDSDGNVYIAYEITGRQIGVSDLRGRDAPLTGLSSCQLADGRALSATGDPNVFTIVATGEKLTRA